MSKESKIICRVSGKMKAQLETEAKQRNEAEAVIIREALREYFESRALTALNDANSRTGATAAEKVVLAAADDVRSGAAIAPPPPIRQPKPVIYRKSFRKKSA